jgi:NAD(P)-dependent dehydrogenase (short-subunit alcohol dehydrogenase family)
VPDEDQGTWHVDRMEFEGKLALVTGSTSGIERATASTRRRGGGAEIALLPGAPPAAQNARCASCGSSRHQLCARFSVGDALVLRIRRGRS